MPGAHRITDDRNCDAITLETGNHTVYVNGLLWAVDGDIDDHCNMGPCKPVVGNSVYCEGKLVIVAPGDTAYSLDLAGCIIPHIPPANDPRGHSTDTFAYG